MSCQQEHNPRFVEGAGLWDAEVCERAWFALESLSTALKKMTTRNFTDLLSFHMNSNNWDRLREFPELIQSRRSSAMQKKEEYAALIKKLTEKYPDYNFYDVRFLLLVEYDMFPDVPSLNRRSRVKPPRFLMQHPASAFGVQIGLSTTRNIFSKE